MKIDVIPLELVSKFGVSMTGHGRNEEVIRFVKYIKI